MLNEATIQLADRLRGLELHAAHSGREVLRVLMQVMDQSQVTKLSDLVEEMRENVRFLLPALPPYAPPLNNINRALLILENGLEMSESIIEVKRHLDALYKENTSPQSIRENIVENLVAVFPSQAVVYTHTLSETVLGGLLELHRNNRLKMVIVTESRPNNDGWDTARRLAEHDLTVQLSIDAAMPSAIEKSHLMLSGAEIINPDGSVIGKIGAYPAAVLCQLLGKPVYIVADSNKIINIPWSDFYLNQITPAAIGLDFSHPSLSVTGTYFDITPSHLIRAYATEKGLISASEIPALVSGMKVSAWLNQVMSDGPKESTDFSLIGEK
jgi:translation initiation factor 2B subunit (eIF-2B alpha/beta/delta family)